MTPGIHPVALVRRDIKFGIGILGGIELLMAVGAFFTGESPFVVGWIATVSVITLGFLCLFSPPEAPIIFTENSTVTFVCQIWPWPSISLRRDQILEFGVFDASDWNDLVIRLNSDQLSVLAVELGNGRCWFRPARDFRWCYRENEGRDFHFACANCYCRKSVKTGAEPIAAELNQWLHQ